MSDSVGQARTWRCVAGHVNVSAAGVAPQRCAICGAAIVGEVMRG